jgi:hypothetical protein
MCVQTYIRSAVVSFVPKPIIGFQLISNRGSAADIWIIGPIIGPIFPRTDTLSVVTTRGRNRFENDHWLRIKIRIVPGHFR